MRFKTPATESVPTDMTPPHSDTLNPLTAGAAYLRVFIFIGTLSTTFKTR